MVKNSRKLRAVGSIITAAVLMVALVISLSSSSYYLCYAVLMFGMVWFLVRVEDVSAKLFGGFVLFYLSIALLNISTFRNLISLETIHMYCVAVLLMLMPLSFIGITPVRATRAYAPRALTYNIMAVHLVLSWLAVLYIYGRYGIVIINQDARFGIPTGLIYAVRSCQFIPLIILVAAISKGAQRINWKSISAWSLLSIAPTLLIASRATAVLVLVAVVIFLISADSYGWLPKSNRRPHLPLIIRYAPLSAGVAILSLAVIIGGWYIRRSGTDQLIDGHVFVSIYFSDNPFSYLIAPLHQGFNETAALTSRIVDYDIRNTFTPTPMIIADFDNMLGRSSVSAAGYFGDRIGRAQAGGLTPGLLGAILLDFRELYWAWFLGIGSLIAYIANKARSDIRVLLVFVIGLSQFIHLFHRGFIKPEYMFLVIIYAGYVLTFRAISPIGQVQNAR